jgi:hypothetical protein
MPEPKSSFLCPLCAATASEPTVVTRGDGTTSGDWLTCAKCRRYSVSTRPGEPYVPTYAKRYR